jgi:uroporphyrinogen-III synthase
VAELDLAGTTIALTAERRTEEFAALLERRGAETVRTPVIHVLPLIDDADLRVQTAALIADPPELVVISTGIGFRGWLEAVASWDLTEQFLGALNRTRIIARGPKAMGAIRGAGLREAWSPAGESSEEVLDHLRSEGVEGVRVAVQLHGIITEWEPLTDLSASLADLGAVVTAISVYRWIRPPDQGPVRALVSAVRSGNIDGRTRTFCCCDARVGAHLLRRPCDSGAVGTARSAHDSAGTIEARIIGAADYRRSAQTSPAPGVTASIRLQES